MASNPRSCMRRESALKSRARTCARCSLSEPASIFGICSDSYTPVLRNGSGALLAQHQTQFLNRMGSRVSPRPLIACSIAPRDRNAAHIKVSSTLDVVDSITDHDCVRYIEDRKSTRLNSSHVAISYAVF